jgi:hypothetical protein
MNVATVIRDQINAIDRMAFFAWGAKEFVAVDSGLRFKTSGMTPWKGYVNIVLDEGKDLYNIHFMRLRKVKGVMTAKVDKSVGDVFCEDLVKVIDEFVG